MSKFSQITSRNQISLPLEMWFEPNHNALPSLRSRGPMPIGRMSEEEWKRLSRNKAEIRVYGGRYVARPSQSL